MGVSPARGWSPGSSSEETDAAASRPHPGFAHQNASLPAGPLVLVGSRGAAGPRLLKGGTPLSSRGGWQEPVEKYCPAHPRREPEEPLCSWKCRPGAHGCLCGCFPQHGPRAPARRAEGPGAGAPQQGRGVPGSGCPQRVPSLSLPPCCVGPQRMTSLQLGPPASQSWSAQVTILTHGASGWHHWGAGSRACGHDSPEPLCWVCGRPAAPAASWSSQRGL